ncbi:hypothetical protein BDW02DRAFT_500627 [Decorospora gaudefroyi]|uniref:Uncharacterized protein n=1 Tax=Decorospora gaudefroyi TaxID=184978 RepID=A0A6A5KEB8_9PLEO|nr:hypothetical protein BDW02DRAFT_500627 [Decorospora gaudefroyi]
MEPGTATHATEGSPKAQSALAAFASALNINENALKTALNGAFDLMTNAHHSPILALEMSFGRLNYRIDSQTLHAVAGAFRGAFGTSLGVQDGK